MAKVPSLTDADFEAKVLKADRPVLIDFSAVWCGPCKALAPIVEEAAAELAGAVDVYTMDIGESPDSAARFGIMAVPTLVLLKGGQELDRSTGLIPKDRLLDWVRAQV